MKDTKFIIIIILMFFGAGIMTQINDYDYTVNNTGIMYQENNNIALNENNRYYDYDIDFNLNESYLHYYPIKKGGLLNSLVKENSKNLASPDLTGKEYLGDGVYRLQFLSGITVDYNVYNCEFKLNGSSERNINLYLTDLPIIEAGQTVSRSTYYISGSIDIVSYAMNWNMGMTDTSKNSIYIDYNNHKSENTITVENNSGRRLFLYILNGRTFDNFTFKLQLEKGTTATPYTVPYIPALQIAFNGTNQVEYINPFEEQIIKINDINNVYNVDFELLNTKNSVVFNWNITTNPNMPFVKFYNDETKLLYDFTDIKEINYIGNKLVGSQSNFTAIIGGAIDLVDMFYLGFQKLFNNSVIETIRDSLKNVWPLLVPNWPWLRR